MFTKLRPCLLTALLVSASWPAAAATGFQEKFALAPDRAAVLQELIPGTPEFFYYSTLQAQNENRPAEVARLLAEWARRFPAEDDNRTLLEDRQRLLNYSQDPAATLAWLRDSMDLTFDHTREAAGTPPEIPTALDPALISWDAYYERAVRADSKLGTLTDSGLRELFHRGLAEKLTPEVRRAILSRLTRPDLPGLVEFIKADLEHEASRGFGEFPIHRNLLLEQLEALVQARPDLLENQNFVYALLPRLAPPDGDDPERQPSIKLAWLERLQAFADKLSANFNSLKASILYARLEYDLQHNTPDAGRLVAYLKFPRPVLYLNPAFRRNEEIFRHQTDPSADFSALTGHGPIGNDQPLVRKYLLILLTKNPDPAPFQPWVENSFLNALLAEAQLTSNPAEAAKYTPLLAPQVYQELRTRTDLEFDPSCRETWLPGDEISLDLHVKNIPRLLVKVFEINTGMVHRSTGKPVNTDLDLDGLVANIEFSQDFDSPPLERVRRTFTFPQLTQRRGVWIIEFIGGGKSSRALIRKGQLTVLPDPIGAGTLLTVRDESDSPVPTAFALLGSQRFAADEAGRILLPFSSTPGEQKVIVDDGSGFTTIEPVELQGETYALSANVHVARESLIPGQTATAVFRPLLLCNGRPTALESLENAKLTLTTTNLDGIPSTAVFPIAKAASNREVRIDFQVPDRLASLQFTVSGEVKSLLTSEPVNVQAVTEIKLNDRNKTTATSGLFLTPSPKGWILSELGRTGEPRADHQIPVYLTHRDFTHPADMILRTDSNGNALLGELPGITTVVSQKPGNYQTFTLPENTAALPPVIHVASPEIIRLPFPWATPAAAGDEAVDQLKRTVSLVETRRNIPVRSIPDGLTLKDGLLAIPGLQPGTYTLYIDPASTALTIRVAGGKTADGNPTQPSRTLEPLLPTPLTITGMTPGKVTPKDAPAPVDALTFQVANATPDTRVHIFASRFLPEYDAFAPLSQNAKPLPQVHYHPFRPSIYQSARTIGEEYRYVLERRSHEPMAGNLLPRPGLLLNPWAIAETKTDKQEAAAGEPPAPSSVETRLREQLADGAMGERADLLGAADQAKSVPLPPDIAFLGEQAVAAYNLQPDAAGNVNIAAEALGHHQILHVVAVSGSMTTSRYFTLPEKPLRTRDLRLTKGLDPAAHFTRQNSITLLEKDVPFQIKDPSSAQFQTYAHLGSAWDLLYNLSHNPTMQEFEFLRTWPSLDEKAKHSLYSKYACHELNFFLSRKDPAFFKSVILPFLANKKDQTFLDHYLLEKDLSPWLALYPYHQLNTAEKVLLARRLDGAHQKAALRDLTDLLNTIPRNPTLEAFLFESALIGKSLSQAGGKNVGRLFYSISEFGTRFAETQTATPMAAAQPAAPATPRPDIALGLQLEAKDAAIALPELESGALTDYAFRGLAKRRTLYRQTELTREWAENNYWHLLIADQNAELIEPNRFWQDYARHSGDTPFLSGHLSETANSFAEIMLALAVLDLPFESDAQAPKTELKDNVLTLTTASRALLFHQEIKPAVPDAAEPALLVSQNFYREGDRYLEENGEKSDKFVTGQFLTGTVYGCQITVTNPGSARRKLEVLFQIPTGSLPVKTTRPTQSIPLELEGFRTSTLDFHFYFPRPGGFAHYPVHISQDGKVAASAAPATFNVVDSLTDTNKNSWDYLSQHGTNAEVIEWLEKHNLHQTDLDRIAWRLKDREFFVRIIALLRDRKFYDETVFSYSILHGETGVVKDFLSMHEELPDEPLESPILVIDPVQRKTFQWLEYSPLINARAHQLGNERQILNDKFRAQYEEYLRLLTFQPTLDDADELAISTVLLLQDRIPEAQAWFKKVNPAQIHERLQYEYLQAWLAFRSGDLATARRLATARTSQPLPVHWLAEFQEVSSQLNEIDGKPPTTPRPEDRDASQDRLAGAEPQLAIKTEAKSVILEYRNLEEVTVNYYPMDLEFLFSANPFVGQDTSRFRSIQPHRTERVTLSPDKNTTVFPLPALWQNANVMIEVTAAGMTQSVASYANQLNVSISENYGQLTVRHAGDQRPLPRTYVKVFAEIDGRPAFYKDGYTDLRGKFDYTSLSTDDLDKTTRFSILILNPEHGATVREVKPPAR